MAQANSTADAAQRKALYDQAAHRGERPGRPDVALRPDGLWAVNKRVKGFQARRLAGRPLLEPGRLERDGAAEPVRAARTCAGGPVERLKGAPWVPTWSAGC